MSFNPDHDDLNEWFFVVFVEGWRMHSAEKDKEALERLNVVCAKTDELIDWCLENMEVVCERIPKPFAQAILNTVDLGGLMARMDEWRDNHTCSDCKLFMTDCVCEEDEEEEEDKKEYEKGCNCAKLIDITQQMNAFMNALADS